ncbi:MAG: tRNA (guanine-N(7)-)-methyltransferase [Rhodomicrobium sp.]|nr:MAG: tRNA (guanine-N(7)-)-methyltransferase [Rhodomicrobium sp.]
MAEDPARKSYLFGRQKAKKLSQRQQALVDTLLKERLIDPKSGPADQGFDHKDRPVWLEIGFGGGEHLSTMAARHKEVNFIGCEPFINGIAKLLVAIEEQNLENIRIYNNDARHVLESLGKASLERVFLLYPDPWPKKRHHKRRFVTTETLDLLAEKLKPGSELLIASDIPDYIRTSLLALRAHSQFSWAPEKADNWRTPPEGWPGTRYEQKAFREGRTPTYLKITRI